MNSTVQQLLSVAWRNFSAGRFAAALDGYGAVLDRDGRQEGALLGCGFCHLNLGTHDQAEGFFRRLLALKPDFPPALAGLGEALNVLGRPQEALAVFQALGRADPQSAMAHHGQGDALRQLGRIDEARRAFEEAVGRAPGDVHHHYALADAGRFTEGDPRLVALEALARNAHQLDDPARCELGFALGKAYDELNRPAEAFAAWQNANAIRRRHIAYDEAAELGRMRALAATFSCETLRRRAGGGDATARPVFVVGMPRSGTTLVEQILASHPAVHGAGETMILFDQLAAGMVGRDFPADFSAVGDGALAAFGKSYAARVQALAPQAERIVDKLPANFLLIGLIHLTLPQARIVHVRRDAADTCLSCYAHLFTAGIDYAYDLGELGRYYRGYEALMAHWRAVLPPDAMLEVRYEDIVGDLEGETKRMLAHCGLDWNEACLAFHRNRRPVHTASSLQVRLPLYRSSLGRARLYEPWLPALRRALADRPASQ